MTKVEDIVLRGLRQVSMVGGEVEKKVVTNIAQEILALIPEDEKCSCGIKAKKIGVLYEVCVCDAPLKNKVLADVRRAMGGEVK